VLHLGKLLALQANSRRDWKGLAGTNTLDYFASAVIMKKDIFITLTPIVMIIKLFSSAEMKIENKLVLFSQVSLV
jgi:hypothetical protein